jgi:hypothetical protein
MDRQEQLLNEMQQYTHLSSFQLEIVAIYMNWAFGIGYDVGRRQPSHAIKVAKMKDGKIIKIYDSIFDIARTYHVDKSTVSKAMKIHNAYWRGYKWKILNI